MYTHVYTNIVVCICFLFWGVKHAGKTDLQNRLAETSNIELGILQLLQSLTLQMIHVYLYIYMCMFIYTGLSRNIYVIIFVMYFFCKALIVMRSSLTLQVYLY